MNIDWPVACQPLYDATGWWVRPHDMFFGSVEIEGRAVARFQRVEDSNDR